MNKLPVKPKLLALALLPLLLVACGGGDDKDNGNNPADPKNPGSNVTPNGKRTPLPNTAVAAPNDEEKAAFEKAKFPSSALTWQTKTSPRRLSSKSTKTRREALTANTNSAISAACPLASPNTTANWSW